MGAMTYEAMTTEYAKLYVDQNNLLRRIDASDAGSEEWRALRKQYRQVALREHAIRFVLLSQKATRFGDWRTPVDIEAAQYIGWAGLYGNAATALREAGVTAEQVLAN